MNTQDIQLKLIKNERWKFRFVDTEGNFLTSDLPNNQAFEIPEMLKQYEGKTVQVQLLSPNGSQMNGNPKFKIKDSFVVQVPSSQPVQLQQPYSTSLAGVVTDPFNQILVSRAEQERDKLQTRCDAQEKEIKALEKANFKLEKELAFKDKEHELQALSDKANEETFSDKLMSLMEKNPELAQVGLGIVSNLIPQSNQPLAGLPEATGIEGLFQSVVAELDTRGMQDFSVILEAIKASPDQIGQLADALRASVVVEEHPHQSMTYVPGNAQQS